MYPFKKLGPEFEQGLIRIGLLAGSFIYLLIQDLILSNTISPVVYTILIALSVLALSNNYWIYINNQYHIYRHSLTNLADIATITYCISVLGDLSPFYYAIYIWLILGNGLRFGQASLIISNAFSLIGFCVAYFINDFWQENLNLWVGLFLLLILTPLYILILLRRLEVAINESKEANQAKGEFLAHMSHELRTPLTAIIGYSELIEEDLDDEQQLSDINKITRSGKHLLDVINGILDFSKIEAGKVEYYFEDVNIRTLANSVIEISRPLAERNNNQFTLDIDESTPDLIVSDEIKLRQILLNLLSNACKFTHSGIIKLSVSKLDDNFVLFSVEDTGIGMNKEQLDRIFIPFAQADKETNRNYGGTGLGLAISKNYCERLGGNLTVSSHTGEGSIFSFTLPIEKSHTKTGTELDAPHELKHT